MSLELLQLQYQVSEIYQECMLHDFVQIGDGNLVMSHTGACLLASKSGCVTVPSHASDMDIFITDIDSCEILTINFESLRDLQFADERLSHLFGNYIDHSDDEEVVEKCIDQGVCKSDFFVAEQFPSFDSDDSELEKSFIIDTYLLH